MKIVGQVATCNTCTVYTNTVRVVITSRRAGHKIDNPPHQACVPDGRTPPHHACVSDPTTPGMRAGPTTPRMRAGPHHTMACVPDPGDYGIIFYGPSVCPVCGSAGIKFKFTLAFKFVTLTCCYNFAIIICQWCIHTHTGT